MLNHCVKREGLLWQTAICPRRSPGIPMKIFCQFTRGKWWWRVGGTDPLMCASTTDRWLLCLLGQKQVRHKVNILLSCQTCWPQDLQLPPCSVSIHLAMELQLHVFYKYIHKYFHKCHWTAIGGCLEARMGGQGGAVWWSEPADTPGHTHVWRPSSER